MDMYEEMREEYKKLCEGLLIQLKCDPLSIVWFHDVDRPRDSHGHILFEETKYSSTHEEIDICVVDHHFEHNKEENYIYVGFKNHGDERYMFAAYKAETAKLNPDMAEEILLKIESLWTKTQTAAAKLLYDKLSGSY